MQQTRFRIGVAVLIAGGIVFAVALATGGDAVYGTAVALVGVGLAVHLTDPIVRRIPLMAVGLMVAIAGAALDSAFTYAGKQNAANTIGVLGIVAGVGLSAYARRVRSTQ